MKIDSFYDNFIVLTRRFNHVPNCSDSNIIEGNYREMY